MDADLKRIIAAGLVLSMLIFTITASASNAGSTTNPLITRSYLEGTFATAMQKEIKSTLSAASDKAIQKLEAIHDNYIGYNFAPSFTQVSLIEGGKVTLSTGGSFILLSGTASLTVVNGELINISTGIEVASGTRLTQFQRYFCTENTTAQITTSSAATGQVDGYYTVDGAGAPPMHLTFTDVPDNAWFFAAIEFVFENELFTGTSTTTFSPNTPMTRAMFVTVLHRLDRRPATESSSDFSDVSDPSQYYYNAVRWANANEIVTGYTDGTFQPDRHVTREQMAAIMYRYATYKSRDLSTPGTVFDTFPDRTSVSGYAAHAMRWAVSWEVMRGSNGNLLPQNTATRAEVAQIIFNYCEKIGR